MTARVAAAGKAFAAFALVAGGYLLGGGGSWPGSWRAIALEEVPVGGAAPIALELPALADARVANVVLLVGDGLGVAQVEAARWAAYGPDGRFVFERFPVVGLTSTAAVGAPVTDSAAAATALATGVATRKGAVGVAADGRRLTTIVEAAHGAGWTTGAVTTTAIHDATPAAFAAHVANRDAKEEIADQLAASGLDLLVGGGREAFEPVGARGRRPDRRDLLAAAREKGVAVVGASADLGGATSLPLWALAPGRLDLPGGDPPLGAWCERALALSAAHAAGRGAGFFLVVEEEGIDSAAHRRQLGAMARAAVRFDAAVAAAARFAAADGRTLVLVVGDHATGGLSFDHTSKPGRLRVAWASGKHTGEPVPIYAYGPANAAARFGGAYHQTEVARRLAALLGLDLSSNWSDTR